MSFTRRPGSGNSITKGEAEVILGLAQGRTIRSIAHDLHRSETAISNRVYRLSVRIGTHTTVHTVVECLRRGLVRLPIDPGGT